MPPVFRPKEPEKRTHSINVRCTDEERTAVDWMAKQLEPEHGLQEQPDVIRRALAAFYAQLKATADEAPARKTRRSGK